MHAPRTILVTGTDTGVGKTLLTGLLLAHLRARGARALAVKPFCSGSRSDVRLLRALQDGELANDEINLCYFKEPLAPLVAARRQHRCVPLAAVLESIRRAARRCDCLLIEGAGGLLAPLGEARPAARRGYTALDMAARLRCEVVVVARNRLGTINHTLLTIGALRRAAAHAALKVVLMNTRREDLATNSNPPLLRELLAPTPLFSLPFLGSNCGRARAIRKAARRLKTALARILA